MPARSITGMTRGCGKRKAGGLYVCTGLSPFGTPIEEFIIDPALPYEGEPFRAPIIFKKDGTDHLLCWVGAENYHYASDFVEEARRFGISKRIPNNFPIDKLTPGSMMFLVHPKALIRNHGTLPLPLFCPKPKPAHLECTDECCLGQSYSIAGANAGDDQRKIGDTVYTVYPRETGGLKYDFMPGIFLGTPITHFDHVMDKGKIDPEIAQKQTHLPLNFEAE